MKVTTKGEHYREKFEEGVRKIEQEQSNKELQEQRIEAIEETLILEATTLALREEIYNKISIGERAQPETREWFDQLNWDKYEEYQTIEKGKLESILAIFETEKLSDDEIVEYLKPKRQHLKEKLVESEIGRELLIDYKEEFFLQLFNDTPELTVQKDKRGVFYFYQEDIREIAKLYAEYLAIDKIYKQYLPVIPEQPHLKDIARSPKHFKTVIDVLSDLGHIDRESLIWKNKEKRYQRLVANLLWELKSKQVYKKVEMTDELVIKIAKNTFDVDFKKRTSQTDDSGNSVLQEILNKIEIGIAKLK